MTKTEMIAQVAEKAGIEKKVATQAVAAMIETITEAMQNGDKVSLVGFGTFEARDRKERMAKVPTTGETVKVEACKVPAFKASKALKTTLNNK